MKSLKLILSIVTALEIFSFTAHANSLDCKGHFAEMGDSKGNVLLKCGEPMLKDSFLKSPEKGKNASKHKTKKAILQCESIDEWTYNPGSGQFLTTLQFERGVLISIKYGARVP